MLIRRLTIIALLLASPQTRAHELLPLPPQLENNVQFWIKIYSLYSKTEVLIHDSERLDIVYDVVDLENVAAEDTTFTARWRAVESIKEKIGEALLELGRKEAPINPETLTPFERKLYNLWSETPEPVIFRKAAGDVRGQRGLAERFKTGLARSGRYLGEIRAILKEYDLPGELCYLPHVESSFNPRAYSRMGAAGLWQFTRSTGRLFLTINYTIDERLDPYSATDAAARLLKKSYQELGAWPLAITAYNHGLAGMARAVRRVKSRDLGVIVRNYRSPTFGFASKNFYAEFIAAVEIARNPDRYFGAIEFEQPLPIKTFPLPDYVPLKKLADRFEIDLPILIQLNPALRRPVLSGRRHVPRGYHLRLLDDSRIDPETVYQRLSADEKHSTQIVDRYVRVRPGDNLSAIAARANTTVRTLMALNGLSDANLIRAGQLLELPGPPASKSSPAAAMAEAVAPVAAATPAAAAAAVTAPAEAHDKSAVPAVVLSDSVSTSDGVENATAAIVGPPPPDGWGDTAFEIDIDEPDAGRIEVQPEETLGHFADWLEIPTRELRQINRMVYGTPIRAGRHLQLTFEKVPAAEFHRRRLEFHRGIQEDFFNNYRIIGLRTHMLGRDENLWELCRAEFEIPFWLLKRYNRERDLDRLGPGETICVPVTAPINGEDRVEAATD